MCKSIVYVISLLPIYHNPNQMYQSKKGHPNANNAQYNTQIQHQISTAVILSYNVHPFITYRQPRISKGFIRRNERDEQEISSNGEK